MTTYSTIYITTPDHDEAIRIGRTLVEGRLAACANVLGNVTSIYRWDGALCEDGEVALILKTRRDLVDRVVERVLELHSYKCPCVVAWPIENGNAAYLDWIGAETEDKARLS